MRKITFDSGIFSPAVGFFDNTMCTKTRLKYYKFDLEDRLSCSAQLLFFSIAYCSSKVGCNLVDKIQKAILDVKT